MVGDFETTVFKGQTYTEVWASGCVELFTDDVKIFHSIEEQFDYYKSLNENITVYYHNLKFDGEFWLNFLLVKKGFKQSYVSIGEYLHNIKWLKDNEMKNNSVKYVISQMGQWYTIIFKVNNHFIELRDSLKLLPFSLKRIGESFGTQHKKLEMEYEGFRYAGCKITDEEKKYLTNDLLVLKEALEIMFKEGNKNLTIGSCCLHEYTSIIGSDNYRKLFPDMTELILNTDTHKYSNVDEWIRKSYKGGWCYVVKGKENLVHSNGVTADVNSLYPSMMSSESGNRYPIGKPTFWVGDYIPQQAQAFSRYFFIRLKTRFKIKEGKLPFIQIKGNPLYSGNECLTTSDVYIQKTGKYYSELIDFEGNIQQMIPELTLTMTDYQLFLEHYDLYDTEILDGCYFETAIGIFDDYIEKYKRIKMKNKGAKRELAKLFLNNLYGKLASSTDSSFKVAVIKEDKSLGFIPVREKEKKAGFIPVGSAITSYARNFTIRTAQANYYGVNKRGFIYADTDSIHCDLSPSELKQVPLHDTNFCNWKLETHWDRAIFVRPKTYIEHVTHNGFDKLDEPYNLIKCAGMPERCKKLLNFSLEKTFCNGDTNSEWDKLNDTEKEFVKQPRELTDFKQGLSVPSKLLPKHISGGILLVETTYQMR